MVAVHAQRRGAVGPLAPAPAGVQRVGLVGQGRRPGVLEIELRVGPVAPLRIGVSSVERIAHRNHPHAQFRCGGSVGFRQALVHGLLCRRFPRFRRRDGKPRIVAAVGPGLMHEYFRLRSILPDGVEQLTSVRPIGVHVVAADAGQPDHVARGPLSYASGALFQDASRRLNAEIQYNNSFGKLNLITGVQYQLDRANSLGTYLLDSDADDYIDVRQVGGYAHLTYDISGGWRVLGAARLDNHEIYDFNFIPKFGILKIGEYSTWRLTYGKGIAAPTILNMFGDLFNGLILGNAEGFTLNDGRVIEKQRVEKIQTFELGYRGRTKDSKFFIDANAYYNISEDFLSPVTVVGVATHRGDTPMSEVQSGFNIFNGLVATYVNFGKVNTYGFDVSGTYYFTPKFSGVLNYSYFNFSFDENDLSNDFNIDGVVDFLDFLVNAPTHKMSGMLNYSSSKWYGSVFGRWVQAYNYFSSFQIASETIPGKVYRGLPIVEGARSADTFNFGPLGGFFTMDLSVGRHLSDKIQVSLAATNVFNTSLREFTATAPTRGLYTVEFRFKL